jgi:pyruvate kinase
MPRTKIVCTIGPASRAPETLERLIRAGMNVARLNFSHGTQAEHLQVITAVRRAAEGLDRSVAILQDLAGLKIRIGEIAGGTITLQASAPFTLTTRKVLGSEREVSVAYPYLTRDVRPGDSVLLSDGDLELQVVGTTAEDVHCRVVIGGSLASRKGVNLPARSITAPTFTEKDRDDLAFGLRHGVDYVALSFVRTAADIHVVQRLLHEHGGAVPLIAKIETEEALTHIDEIVESVDGVMVARGDLGVDVPLATVPRLQKMLIGKANRAGKPVITATHMLRSMQDSPRPTRAEAADVANAVLDGTDAVMLSEETAIGRFPVEAVKIMAAIADDTETGFPFDAWMNRFEASRAVPEAVARAACTLAAHIDAAAIVTCTRSGSTARRIARYRPRVPILAPTPHQETYRRLALVWGVTPLLSEDRPTTDEVIDGALRVVQTAGHVRRGHTAVVTAAASPDLQAGASVIRVHTL